LTELFSFSFFPNSLPSSLREKGTSLRLPASLFTAIAFVTFGCGFVFFFSAIATGKPRCKLHNFELLIPPQLALYYLNSKQSHLSNGGC